MKTVKQKTEEWEQLNTQNAVWLRDPSDVTPEEYEKFYQAIAKARKRRCRAQHGTDCVAVGTKPGSVAPSCIQDADRPLGCLAWLA